MNQHSAPPQQIIYEQIQCIELRRLRIIDSISFHFGSDKVKKILKDLQQSEKNLLPEPFFEEILDENTPDQCLEQLV